jgi:NAD(P)-dependent dehydrogenase (short-subunit alcohol dehydrogenase family)
LSVLTMLVTGASRGIGLEFIAQGQVRGWRIFASCRNPREAGDLAALAAGSRGLVTVHQLDVRSPAQIRRLASELAGQPIDILVNNAGVYGPRPQGLRQTDDRAWGEALETNVMGPLHMAEAFADHVAASRRRLIVTLSSRLASIGQNTSGGEYIYRATKAGANAVVRSLAVDLAGRGIICVALSPGWVRTDMGGPAAPLSVTESVAGMLRVITTLGRDDSGRFLVQDGGSMPW